MLSKSIRDYLRRKHKESKSWTYDPSMILDLWGYLLIGSLFFPIINTFIPSLSIDIGSLPVVILTILAPTLLVFRIIFILFSRKKATFKVNLLLLTQVLVVFTVLLVLGYSSFNVLTDLSAPMLHDPYHHSMWAKMVLVSNKIEFFYSPLLHSVSAIFSVGRVEQIPWIVTFFTQLSIFLIPINYALLFFYFTKNAKYTILFFLFVSLLDFPASLYYTAGKNALILGLSIIPFTVISLDRAMKDLNKKEIIRASLSLFLLFMAHYPIFGVLIFLIIPWILGKVFRLLKTRQWKNLILVSSLFITGATLCLIWFVPLYSQNTSYLDQSVFTTESATPNLKILTILSTFRFFFNKYVIGLFQVWHIVFLLPIFIKGTKASLRLTFLWGYLSFFLSYAFVEGFYLTNLLEMVPNAFNIIFQAVLLYATILVVTLTFMHIKIKKLYYAILIFLVTAISIHTHFVLNEKIISAQNAFNVVSQEDLEAYKFMRENFPNNTVILNAGIEDSSRPGAIYPTDGGIWIPLYTNNTTFIDFRDFSSVQTNKNNALFQRIIEEDDDSQILSEIKEMGIEYGYLDTGIYGPSLSESVLSNVNYEVVFESGHVKLIRF